MPRLVFLIVFGLTLFCSVSIGTDSPILVDARNSGLVIYNDTTESVYFALLETRASAGTKWQPCQTPALCNYRGVLPAKSARMDYARIYGWYPGANVNLYWWHLRRNSASPIGYVMDGPHSRTITTPHIATRSHLQAFARRTAYQND